MNSLGSLPTTSNLSLAAHSALVPVGSDQTTPAAPTLTPTDSFISVSLLPQDPMISQVETVQFRPEQFGKQLSGDRLKCQDKAPVAKADEKGNYLPEFGTPQFDQVNVHGVVAGTLLAYDRYMGHPARWNFDGPLLVRPHAGEGKTAYYQRQTHSINFCQWDSPSLGKTVKTSQALDIGSHETGHAILDGLRPGLLSGTESKAFHEGFGDSSAIIHALQYDSNLEKILAENQGDFSKPSLITRLAEEFGTAFNKEDENPNNDDHPYYRTALNDFKYKDPKQLPSDSYPPSQPEEVLTSEAHSFSRVWSGSFYSMLGSLFNECSKTAPTQLDSLRTARDVLGTIWGHALDRLPASNLKFKHVAQAMLAEANQLEGGKYFNSLASVIVDRNLMTPQEVEAAQQGGARIVAFAPFAAFSESTLQSPDAQVALAAAGWQQCPVQEGAEGRRIYTWLCPETIDSTLSDGTPAQIEANSGLTVVFGPDGRLIDSCFTPLEDEDRADVSRQVHSLLASGSQAVQVRHNKGSLPTVTFEPTWDA